LLWKRQAAGQAARAQNQRVRTSSASKTCRTINGCHEGKSQARKSYFRQEYLLSV